MTIKTYIEFNYEMAKREFKARYKKALFGFLWILLNPLCEMLIIGTVFSHFINIPNYYTFLISGLIGWQFFSLSINKATPSFDHQRHLLKKASFPRESIPLSIIFSNLVNFIFSILLLTGALFVLKLAHLNVISVIVSIFWLALLTIGLSLITSPINTRYRDINFIVQTSMVLIFYATPILYKSSQLPKSLQHYLLFNPLAAPIELLRAGLIGGQVDKTLIITNALATCLIFTAGVVIFKKMNRHMVDWL